MAITNENLYDEREKEEESTRLAQLQPLSATDQADTTFSGDTNVPQQTTTPPAGKFPGQGGEGTSSNIDLTDKANEKQMWVEYNNWKDIGKSPNPRLSLITTGSIWEKDEALTQQRELAKEQWYQKYYGMTPAQYEGLKDERKEKYDNYSAAGFSDTIRNLTDLSMGATTDWWMDYLGVLPGMGALDNLYDKNTKSKTGLMQGARKMLSIVVPSILSGGKVAQQLGKLPADMPKYQKRLVAMGAYSAQEAAVIGLSDVGEDENALRALNDFFPGVFGPKGMLPIPDWAKTLDSDSPRVRKYKNMFDTAGLSMFGTVLGSFIQLKGGKRTMQWHEPLDEAAARYKQQAIVQEADIEKLLKIQEIDTQLALGSDNISSGMQARLIDERMRLMSELDQIEDLDAALDALDDGFASERSTAAQAKQAAGADPTEFDPDITPILDEAGNARQSIPPGNVARNMADVAANKTGISLSLIHI